MLWLKALHVIFMVTWFAGLFYLPRLFVYHSQEIDKSTVELFKIMERRLLAMMTLGAVLTALFGLWMLFQYWDAYKNQGWLHTKLLFVTGLIGYHIWCWRLVRAFKQDRNPHSETWYRWFNEVPIIPLVIIVILVIIRPY